MNALTVDVEDYHNVFARDRLGRDGPPTRAVVRNTQKLLDLFAEAGVRGTFFLLGEVAECFPQLIRDIAAGNHELAVHGYHHRQVFKLSPDEFRREVADAKARIEDLIGNPVKGHRAPAFSIMPQTRWALEVLVEVGFRYDSSIFPIAGRRYGWPGFPLDIHKIPLETGRQIIEVPLSTISLLGKRLPSCGGGYLRHFPGFVTRWAMRRVAQKRPAVLYMHPYEIELDAPAIETAHLDWATARRVRWIHRLQLRNRRTVETKIARLLSEFRFAPMREVIDHALGTHSADNQVAPQTHGPDSK